MEIHRLPPEEASLRRFAEELWLPYHRELEATVEAHALADDPDVDLVAEEVPFRLERLESADYRAWVALDEAETQDASDEFDLAGGRGDLVGFVTTEINESPSVFDRPDRLMIGDIYVRESHRGTGLAPELVDHAANRAGEMDCTELVLDVDVDNERALAFYEKLGFEPYRRRMTVRTDDL